MANESTVTGYPRAGDRTPTACAQREEHWRRVLTKQRQSGLTPAAFCRRDGTSAAALNWWAREIAKRDGTPRKANPTWRRRAAFVPVRVIQAKPQPPPKNASPLEIVMHGGLVVRVLQDFDPVALRRLLAALENRPC